jgi:hypothetical protein
MFMKKYLENAIENRKEHPLSKENKINILLGNIYFVE